MCMNIRSICFHRPSLMNLNNDAATATCKEYRIRGCVSISGLLFCIKLLWITLKNDEEKVRCKGDQIRDLFAFIRPYLMTLNNDAETARCKGNLIRLAFNVFKEWFRDSQMYVCSDYMICINIRPICLFRIALSDLKNDVKEIGLEDVYQYQSYYFVKKCFEWLKRMMKR